VADDGSQQRKPDFRTVVEDVKALLERRTVRVLGVLVLVAGLAVAVLIGYRYDITLWDWGKLLIVPAAIAAGSIWFNQQQQTRQQETQDQHSQDEALQGYLDQLTQLLVAPDEEHNEHLIRRQVDDDVRQVIQARSEPLLRSLNPTRRFRLILFLSVMGLLTRDRPLVSLANADLREVDGRGAPLQGVDLQKADLRRADLSRADLSEADLSDAILSWADLEGANLSDAILRKADLTMAFLSGVDMTRANLLMANLSGANKLDKLSHRDEDSVCLRQAVLIGANLTGANLVRADLRGAKLSGANLSGADLSGAKLSGADLAAQDDKKIEVLVFRHEPDLQQKLLREANKRGADLSGANLWGATGMSNKEFERQAASLKGATMPEGHTYEDWVKRGRPPRSQHKRSQSE